MNREDVLTSIYNQFEQSTRQFCEETQAVYFDISKEYKGEETPENLKHCIAKIYYNSYRVSLIYMAHSFLSVANSILGCSVCFDKSEETLEIPLPLLTDYCDVDIATPMFIPTITNKEGMIQAFECVGDVLKQMHGMFIDISHDVSRKASIMASYYDELKIFYGSDEFISYSSSLDIYEFFMLRCCSDAFINYVKGDTDTAIKQLKKIKKPSGYESRMIKLLSMGVRHEIPESSSLIANAKTYNKHGVQGGTFKEFIILLLSWLILTIPTSVVFLVIYLVLVLLEGRDSVALLGPKYNIPYAITSGFFLAISISYFVRKKFTKIFDKKNYEKFCELDSIQNSVGSDKIMKGFIGFVFFVSVISLALLSRWNVNFLSDGFIDNTKFFSIKGQYYTYEEIEEVYYLPNRENDFGDILDFPSYVIKMTNGKEIDLYEYAEIEDYEDSLLPYLREKGVTVITSEP